MSAPREPTLDQLAPLPGPSTEPGWLLVEEGFALGREHEVESLFTVGNGYSGTRGSAVIQGTPLSFPATFLAGFFDRRTAADLPELAIGPDWTSLRFTVEGAPLRLDEGAPERYRRTLDLRHGILWREWLHRDHADRLTWVRGMRLASQADRHVLLQAVELVPQNYTGRVRIEARIERPPRHLPSAGHNPLELQPVESIPEVAAPLAGSASPLVLEFRTLHPPRRAAFAAASRLWGADQAQYRAEIASDRAREHWETEAVLGQRLRLDRLVAVHTSRDVAEPAEAALARLRTSLDRGAEGVLAAHVQAWEARWADADVTIEGDDDAQRLLRFAIYHLISAANPDDDEVSVGARGLTGEGYKGHVFWDTEIFMLPFYTLAFPPAARAMLMYRYRTLDAARRKAAAGGYRGALYAWESADTGEEATPSSVVGPDGEVIPILTGEQEHHISADVAYAVWQYWQTTGDDDFFRTAGAEILLETARFWASRVHRGHDGAWHIARVVGPDEYHEAVDDNAYTNLLAQWTLEAGVETCDRLRDRWPADWEAVRRAVGLDDREPPGWAAIAREMHTGLRGATGLLEQFAGYFALDDVDLSLYRGRNMPLDLLLGRAEVQRSQIVKQADVVMALYLLWDRLPPAVRLANFRYYEPRTAHGSSLSPAIHAAVAARLGDLPLALRYLRQAGEIDLGNNMGNASHGVHMAALGGLWQAVVQGFAGIRADADAVIVAPHLPPQWRSLRCRLRWRGRRVTITARRAPAGVEVHVEGKAPVPIQLGPGPRVAVPPGRPQAFDWAPHGGGR